VVPTVSLDSGAVFERDADYFGRAFIQTLEPRAYYVYTPYRNQNYLPNYDSAANDFNFATVYTENEFSGEDRISNSNVLTLGVTSRLIDPVTGAEAARLEVAQRFRFADELVTVPGTLPNAERLSDLLVGSQINWTPKWNFSGIVAYNDDAHNFERATLRSSFNPGPYQSFSAAYLYQTPTTPTSGDGDKSVDLTWQWPLNNLWGDYGKDLGRGRGQGGGRWYGVGRINYSMLENRLTEGVLGFEYDGCCWIGRVVLQRTSTSTTTQNTRLMFQLELLGFAAVGSNPSRALLQNIQNYTPLRDPNIGPPGRFSNYD
jgi:LPS-assembly protein